MQVCQTLSTWSRNVCILLRHTCFLGIIQGPVTSSALVDGVSWYPFYRLVIGPGFLLQLDIIFQHISTMDWHQVSVQCVIIGLNK